MLIATWNVNSIRTRLEQVKTFLKTEQPDLLCIQETKVQDHLFPEEEFIKEGYFSSFHGQKAYNGVALISPHKLYDIRLGFSGELNKDSEIEFLEEQKRIISCLINDIRVVNVYVPNGSSLNSPKFDYKLKWLKYLKKYLEAQEIREEPLCLLGDFNIALEGRDIHNPEKLSGGIMASKQEREGLKAILGSQLHDVFRIFEPDTNHWSWWDYRSKAWDRDKGWRIDHIYLSDRLLDQAKNCLILKATRGVLQPSDHAPVMVNIVWPPEENGEESFFE